MNYLNKPILYNHWREVPEWFWEICPSFHPTTDPKLVSSDTGAFQVHIPSMLALQKMRDTLGPLKINSGYRTPVHNARSGGSPNSYHKTLIAFDIPYKQYSPIEMEEAARQAGFTGIGRYVTFIHVDMGKPRTWYGSQRAKKQWHRLTNFEQADIVLSP